MIQLSNIYGYQINVCLPNSYENTKQYKLLVLNDGDMLNKYNLEFDGIIVGIVPNNRLCEYTPWYEKAIREGQPDFLGKNSEYNSILESKIIPEILKRYSINKNYIIYAGYSLGGLCAISSLYQNQIFTHIISICGSFWFNGFKEYVAKTSILNTKAQIILLNGKKEGVYHTNILRYAYDNARDVHSSLLENCNALSIFDSFGHHENIEKRLKTALSLIY